MIITDADIVTIFGNLLNKSKSREEVARWANSIREAEDASMLKYVPIEREPDIWEAILFLAGVDFKDAPNEYLHSENDVKKALMKFQKKMNASHF